MKIEHVAFQVADPAAMAAWYVEHLGFTIRRSGEGPAFGRFLADGSGCVMLELYRNPAAPVPDYRSIDPILLHVAFVCDDLPATVDRLVVAGAERLSGPSQSGGDQFAMLRDPWGLAIQLVRRAEPML